MRILFAITVLIVLGLLTAFAAPIRSWLLIEGELSWFLSFLVPQVIYLFGAMSLAYMASTIRWSRAFFRVIAFVVVLALTVSGYLMVNTPYQDDWILGGDVAENDPNIKPIERYLGVEREKEFTGLACLALAGCDYCINTIDDLMLIKSREPELDMAIFVFAVDSSEVMSIQKQVEGSGIWVTEAPEPDTTYRITYGNFPTLLLIKNTNVERRWFYNQFGFQAKDMVESLAGKM